MVASRATVTDAQGKVAVSDVTSTEVSHLDSSNIQTAAQNKLLQDLLQVLTMN